MARAAGRDTAALVRKQRIRIQSGRATSHSSLSMPPSVKAAQTKKGCNPPAEAAYRFREKLPSPKHNNHLASFYPASYKNEHKLQSTPLQCSHGTRTFTVESSAHYDHKPDGGRNGATMLTLCLLFFRRF